MAGSDASIAEIRYTATTLVAQRHRVTLDTIAHRLGISKYSVSRALAGAAGVSEEMRRSVRAAAIELGYRHASLRGAMPSLRGKTVVLFLPGDDHQGSEYWLKVMAGVQAEAERFDVQLITRSIGGDSPAGEAPARDAHGTIIAGHGTRTAVAPHLTPGLATLLVGYPVELEAIDAVTVADRAAGRGVGEALLRLGHRRVAFVSERDEATRNQRFRGLRDAFDAVPAARTKRLLVDGDELAGSLDSRLREVVKRGTAPTALFCSTDVVAFAAIRALNRRGVRVPEDVSVVGFNDYAESAHHAPSLTTVRVPMHHLGATAMRVLCERLLESERDRPFTHTMVVPELVVRASTGPAS